MLPLSAGLFLIFTLITVHFYYKIEPANGKHILDIDKKLPFPAAGQGSSLFSITAFFSVYIGMFILLGLPAMIGIAIGMTFGLYLLQRYFRNISDDSFHDHILLKSKRYGPSGDIILSFIIATQIGFAASELLILKAICTHGLEMSMAHASVLVVSLGLVGYYYCMMGKYVAVFKTDIVQYIFVLLMCFSISIVILYKSSTYNSSHELWDLFKSLKGYWNIIPNNDTIQMIVQLFIGFLMGLSFPINFPDTWKRVFIVVKHRRAFSFYGLVLAGILPFLLVFAIVLARYNSSQALPGLKFLITLTDSVRPELTIIVLLGLFSSFLSSFDSAILSSAHLLSITKSESPLFRADSGIALYHKNMGLILLLTFGLYFVLPVFIHNLYFLGNVLLGNFIIIAAFILGTSGFKRKISKTAVVWIFSIGTVSWLIFLFNYQNIIGSPTPKQINSIQYCPILLLFIFVATKSLSRRCSN